MRPGSGSTGWKGEPGRMPGRHALADTAAVDWTIWFDTAGFLRTAAFATTEVAGFNFNTGGSALAFREGPDGTAAYPSRTYLLDTDTGSFRIGANNEGFSAGGVLRWDYNTLRINSTIPFVGPVGSFTSTTFNFGTAGTGLFQPAANTVGVALGAGWYYYFTINGMQLRSGLGISWSSSATDPSISPDVALSRGAANVLLLASGDMFAFGGVTSSEVLIKRSSATFQFRLGNDSAFADVLAAGFVVPSNTGTGIGYATGSGGTVTQATDKGTGVTLNTYTGEITMNAAALNAGVSVAFVLTNSLVATGDYVLIQHVSAGTSGAYVCQATAAAGTASIVVTNRTAGNLSEAIVIKFVVVKSTTT